MAQKKKAAGRQSRVAKKAMMVKKAEKPAAKTTRSQGGSEIKPAAPPPPKITSEPPIDRAKSALKREARQVAVAAARPGKPEKAEKPENLKSRSRRISVEASPNEAVSALAQKWSALFKKSEQIEAKPYNMKSVFEEKTAIVHKVLGWGYILANRNDRLEVLFKDGIKYLISNYKP